MMNKIVITAALVAALPLSTPAIALDYFLKIGDVRGESDDSKHKDEIDVLEWSWGVTNRYSASGGGGGASRPVFSDFTWEQGLDRSFVPLFVHATSGVHLGSAVLSVRRSDGLKQEFFQMTFGEVFITSLRSQTSGDSVDVHAAMSFSTIEMAYRPEDAHGALGAAIKGSWDLRRNEAVFTGDPTVVLGLLEAGGSLAFVPGVPEPATWASLAAGLGLVGVMARRRRTAPGVTSAGG